MLSSWPPAAAPQAALPASGRTHQRQRVTDGLANATTARGLTDAWARGLVVDALEPTTVLPMVKHLVVFDCTFYVIRSCKCFF